MNKTELITFLRDPNLLSSKQLEELEAVVNEYPYFLSARLLLAKASKEQGHQKTKKRVASAAVYSTDRILLKKYLNGNLFFLSHPPKIEDESSTEKEIVIKQQKSSSSKNEQSGPNSQQGKLESKETEDGKTTRVAPKLPPEKSTIQKTTSKLNSKTGKAQPEVPDLPSGDIDSILEELNRDMKNLKESRDKFAEVQQKIEEDDAVSEALKKASSNEEPKKTLESPQEIKDEVPSVEASKKSASEITKQILDAAKKAKEEVAREEAEVANEEEIAREEEVASEEVEEVGEKQNDDFKGDSSSENDESTAKNQEPETTEIEAQEAVDAITTVSTTPPESTKPNDSDESLTNKDRSDDQDSGRAEKVIREPRFSRFASRSYLKPPEDVDSSLLDDGDSKSTESKKKENPSPEEITNKDLPQEKKNSKVEKDPKIDSLKAESGTTEEDDSAIKIKLPDLSKAKPVPRRNKRTKKDKPTVKALKVDSIEKSKLKEAESESAKEENKKQKLTTSKKSAKSTEDLKNSAETDKAKKPKTPVKKKTTSTAKKASEKKTVAKKTTTKKAPAKKSGTKTSSAAKSTSKRKSNEASEDNKDDGKGERQSQQDIIDKFIKESPTIKYQRKEETSSPDLAEHSAAWDPNLASEYLAEIYLHQGNKKRAIEIYEALSLKYPEKKSYFADLISKIE